ncbi:MAG: flagellar hook-associated protein FlgK [Pseudomonadota bacterium]
MPNLFNLATSGLIATQRALAVTSNNIVNANTEGYTRQVIDFRTLPSQSTDLGFFGSGVTTGSSRRIYNEFLTNQVRDLTASRGGHTARADLLGRLDNLIADPEIGLTGNLQRFFNSLSDLAAQPSSVPARQVALSEAESLETQVSFLQGALSDISEEVNTRTHAAVEQINQLSASIAELNGAISELRGDVGTPNELLDERDVLLNRLSGLIGFSSITEDDNSISVLVGDGHSLVLGATANQLTVEPGRYDPSELEISMSSVSAPITSQITGGELASVVSFGRGALNHVVDQVGLMVSGLSATFNAQHQLGLNLSGVPGGDFFVDIPTTVLPHANNAGSGTVTADITDIGQLQGTSYIARFDGSQWSVTRDSDGEVTTGAGPIVVDGMTVSFSGTATAGDSFAIQPVRRAAAMFQLNISRPEDIAVTAPLRSTSENANTGDAQISRLAIASTTGLPLASDVTLTFDPDALGPGVPGFTVTGSVVTTLAYDPATERDGKTFSLPDVGDVSITVEGVPGTGDVLRISNNQDGVGDNRNLLALTDLANSPLLDGASSTYHELYGNMIARVGSETRQANISVSTSNDLLNLAISDRESISGVNIDEEAASLLRYQQSYQAAAQMVAVADDVFQTLLAATRR